jgi:hypothetical protein
VHRRVKECLGGKAISEPFFWINWRDGGLGLASVRERQDLLSVRAVVQILKTPDEELGLIMHRFADAEPKNRQYVEDEEAEYLNCGGGERKHQPTVRTTTIFTKALEALNRLGRELHVMRKEVNIERPNGKPHKSTELGGICNYVTKSINRAQWRERMLHDPKKGGAPYYCAKYFISSFGNESSNSMLKFAQYKASDTILSFMVRGKLDTLPTLVNRRLWYRDHETICIRCGRAGVDLKHVPND